MRKRKIGCVENVKGEMIILDKRTSRKLTLRMQKKH